MKDTLEKGGAGSGHFGHAGRPGQIGGSVPNNAGSPWDYNRLGGALMGMGKVRNELYERRKPIKETPPTRWSIDRFTNLLQNFISRKPKS